MAPWLVFVLAMLFGVACARPNDHPRVIRFIEDDPTELFQPSVIASSNHTFDWSFEGDDAEAVLANLHFVRGSGSLRPEGVYLSPENGEVAIALPGPIDTEAVDTLVITLFGRQRGEVGLRWSSTVEGDRLERLSMPVRPDGTYALSLRSHPRWKGEAHEPQVYVASRHELALKSIVAGRRELASTELESAVARAWKVDLGEVRNALLAPPGLRISRELEIPEGLPVFNFGYGMTEAIDRPVVFRVIAERTGTGREEVLWEQKLAGDRKRTPSWQTASVDLSPFAGTGTTLVLETAVDGERLDPVAGLPVWGHPEIVPWAPTSARPNVILISIDTLRADRLSIYGNPRELTPHLDAWARRHGVVFENAVASAPWTLPSHVSMLTGIDSVHHGANMIFSTAPLGPVTLADYLRDAGYWTAAITGAGIMHPKFGFFQGHEIYHYRPERAPQPQELEESVSLANEWLSEMREPFFLFFHTYSVHKPYMARQPYYGKLTSGAVTPSDPVSPVTLGRHDSRSPENAQVVRDRYDSGVAHMDAQMGLFLQRFEELGLRDRTLVIFTSDHGEALGEDGHFGHFLLQDHNLLVPLVIELPDGTGAGRAVSRQVRSVDTVPRILDALDMTRASDVDGMSLLSLMRGEEAPELPSVAVSYGARGNRGISLRVSNRMKFTYKNAAWSRVHGREALYLLETDPLETENVAVGHPKIVARLRAKAQRIAAQQQGLWIRLSNAGPGSLSGTISGIGITKMSATSFDLSCSCVDAVREGQLSFEVPAGTSYHLILESTGLGLLTVEGALKTTTSSTFREILNVRSLTDVAAIHYSADGWSFGEQNQPSGTTGIELWWEGVRSESDLSPQGDAEIRDQLRALGYLE